MTLQDLRRPDTMDASVRFKIVVEDAFFVMSDGTSLHATVTRPDTHLRVPVIVIRTPYLPFTAVQLDTIAIARRGAAVVVQSTRGTGQSEGEFEPFVHEVQDGVDTAAWCRTQPWSNGRLGSLGRSYLALTQLYTVAGEPHGVEAMGLEVCSGDPYDFVYRGGALFHGMLVYWAMRHANASIERRASQGQDMTDDRLEWDAAMDDFGATVATTPLTDVPTLAKHFPTWQKWLEHPERDQWWARASRPEPRETGVPALYVGGWHDIFLADTVREFRANRHPDSRLIIGPWAHTANGSVLGQANYGYRASADAAEIIREQVDFVLSRITDTVQDTAPHSKVRVFVMGGANSWSDETVWPPRRARDTEFFLHPDGVLVTDPGVAIEGVDSFIHDPHDPVPTVGGANFFLGSDSGYCTGQQDQGVLDARTDILRYTSSPFEHNTDILGAVHATLFVTSTAPSSDWAVKLIDIDRNGRALDIVDGIVRTPLPLDTTDASSGMTRVSVDVGDTAYRVLAGHRIRVDISGSNFPRFDRNPGTDGLPGMIPADEFRTAEQSVLVAAGAASFVTVPLSRATERAS
ncbi:CocE/NonD family hydrolase [Rhodococcus fascians]|uniref:CocE/NonD family hydrolase n=1 Tax=Rhodococcoides fascians TaxID=1828 RepID=UPI001961A3FB|nr:CocE/NonD family hydrolase [Rhodococcus fascians]MBM7244247.1 CocE/NonD family hydrolase [Rhodococcus fascians]MBY3810397.1 CocE/NonD family hydrolase [Rhodococcus fascians]MBY3841980.1 CocE/NonD family hydrolase [Rhodococcus fascians]MBY3844431.1 CocE/NonD family hydrolase [Rhodococcus fascians]MBY3850377.1 CocE/NonD family hydrolase [Rhodococcus fascians]